MVAGSDWLDFYSEATSRNWAFVSPEEQERLRAARVLIAGCGLGSVIAVQASQTGFTDFIIADHDAVEVSNLNRQAFDRSHVSVNKARALASILEARSEVVTVEALEASVTPENAASLVERADVVVNTVDFDETTYALNAAARDAGKPVVFPMNMGWGGFCLVFTAESTRLEDLVGTPVPDGDAEFLGRLLGALEDFSLPGYLAERLHELPDIVDAADLPAPQLGVAAARSATLVVEAMVRLTLGSPVRVSPRPMHLDAWDAWVG